MSPSRAWGKIYVPKLELGNEKKLVGRASTPAASGGTGFTACALHRQDAGASMNFSGQSNGAQSAPSIKNLQARHGD
jgi:hypothetical protein